MPEDSTNLFYEKASFIAEYIWVPVILPLFIVIYKHCKSNILYIKKINKRSDTDIENFISLYNTTIPTEYRICPEEIIDFVGTNKNKSMKHYLYICKLKNKTVGFIKFMVSTKQKYIFIAYIAKDKNDKLANEKAIKALVKKLYKKHFNKKNMDAIIIETNKPSNGNYNTNLNKSISRYANEHNLECYYVDVNYKQPNMPDDDFNKTAEKILSLIYIPKYKLNNKLIQKNVLLDIIKSIYFEIYFPSCNKISDSCEEYNSYLISIISEYEKDFDEYIKLYKI